MNIIKSRNISKDEFVHTAMIDWLYERPDLPKEELGLFNFWSEKKRSGVSDTATISYFVLDYDNGARRRDVEKKFAQYRYIIYNSTGNKESDGIEKFRLILKLKEPISANDLRFWKNENKFKEFFKGVDESSFAVGRFFYRPSRYDKDRKEVIVTDHIGEDFDFNSIFTGRSGIEMFEKAKELMRPKPKEQHGKNENMFDEWVSRKYPSGVHYSDICAFCLRANSCGLSEEEAEMKFEAAYAGHSDWKPNFRKVFGGIK